MLSHKTSEIESVTAKGGNWIILIKSATNVLKGDNFVFVYPELLQNKLILRRGEVITSEILERKDLDNKNINSEIKKRNLSDTEITEKLKLIGCTLNNKEYGWDVEVIPNRSQDLLREIDLIEEIARLIGYDLSLIHISEPTRPY